jgi:hypothetical protein
MDREPPVERSMETRQAAPQKAETPRMKPKSLVMPVDAPRRLVSGFLDAVRRPLYLPVVPRDLLDGRSPRFDPYFFIP